MQSWFNWKGKNSRDMGLWVTTLPGPTRAAERVKRVTIPGRSGQLTYKEGDNVYDPIEQEITVTARRDLNFDKILDWLSGSGDLVLSSNPNRAYEAQINGAVIFENDGPSLCLADIPFFCQPLKKQFPEEALITTAGEQVTIYNPGDVPSKPVVRIGIIGVGNSLNIAGRTMGFTAEVYVAGKYYVPGDHVLYNGNMYMFHTAHGERTWDATKVWLIQALQIDCEAKSIVSMDSNGNMYGFFTGTIVGDFWELPVGNFVVYANSGVHPTIQPRWRWL